MKKKSILEEAHDNAILRGGREDKYPYYHYLENPNQSYTLLHNAHFYDAYHELLTDGKVVINMDEIAVEDATFVIVREKKLGQYCFANLYTEDTSPVKLSYYDYLTSGFYPRKEKIKEHVYVLK